MSPAASVRLAACTSSQPIGLVGSRATAYFYHRTTQVQMAFAGWLYRGGIANCRIDTVSALSTADSGARPVRRQFAIDG